MNKMYPMNKAFLASAVVMLSNNVFGTVIIQNNFDGVADDIGPAFQLLTNGASGGPGTFDPNTGLVTTSGTATNASGFNNVSLQTVPVGTVELTAVFEISGATDFDAVRSNGFFLGLVTGTDANGTGGSALFNNDDASSIGLNLTPNRIVRDGLSGGAQTLQTITAPTVASVQDGFTFTLTLREDETYDAFTTGLLAANGSSADVSILGDAIGAQPTFANFLSGGVGVNGTVQGGPAQFTIDSVTLTAVVPEPSTSMLVGLVSGLALFGRRRRSF